MVGADVVAITERWARGEARDSFLERLGLWLADAACPCSSRPPHPPRWPAPQQPHADGRRAVLRRARAQHKAPARHYAIRTVDRTGSRA